MPATPQPNYKLKIGGYDAWIRVEGLGEDAVVERVPGTEPPTATARITCNWTERYGVMKGLAGGVSGTAQKPVRIDPFLYPDSPNLRCIAIPEIKGIGLSIRPDGWPTYQKADMSVVFGVYPWAFGSQDPSGQGDPSGKPYFTVKFKATSEIVVPQGGTFKWSAGASAGTPIPGSGIGFLRPKAEIAVTEHWMPAVPVQFLDEFAGTLNPFPVPIGDKVYGRGQLMYGSLDAELTADTLGNFSFQVTHIILVQQVDWNKFLDPSGTYQYVDTAGFGNGSPPFQYADWYSALVS